ncbi:sensor histidine kinase [Marinicellulosiphila megalodicopiae]|uniref:sensor histidine kinase n=1 Tax=Marinicellulosiphila megalodicopiae TaxID=2724896 RepID=UPI003BB03AEF
MRVCEKDLGVYLENLSGYIAWMIMCFLIVKNQSVHFGNSSPEVVIAILLMLGFIVTFYFSIRDEKYHHYDRFKRLIAIDAQFVFVLLLFWVVAEGFVGLLLLLVVAQLPFKVNPIVGFFSTLVMAIVSLFVLEKAGVHSGEFSPMMRYLLFIGINFFVYAMASKVHRDKQAKDKISLLNEELILTHNLLNDSVKQGERLRISRELHDLLGHHLTALILNLQFLTHTTEGKTQEKVKASHDLAKLLLSDVRETVQDIRKDSIINLKATIEDIIKKIPRLQIEFNINSSFRLSNAAIAEAIVRVIQESLTNSLKHSSATTVKIDVQQVGDAINVNIHDNGGQALRNMNKTFAEGNGITGMRERIERLGGQLIIDFKHGFKVAVNIPHEGSETL